MALRFPKVVMASASNYPDDEIGGMGDMFTDDEVEQERKSREAWEMALAIELENAVTELRELLPEPVYLKHHSIMSVAGELRKQAKIDKEAAG